MKKIIIILLVILVTVFAYCTYQTDADINMDEGAIQIMNQCIEDNIMINPTTESKYWCTEGVWVNVTNDITCTVNP